MKTRIRLLATFSVLLVAVMLLIAGFAVTENTGAYAKMNAVEVNCNNEDYGEIAEAGSLNIDELVDVPNYSIDANVLTITYGAESKTFTATANAGCEFIKWNVQQLDGVKCLLCTAVFHGPCESENFVDNSPTLLAGDVAGFKVLENTTVYYCLKDDIRLTGHIPGRTDTSEGILVLSGATLNLCLCGHDIDMNNCRFGIEEGATLNLYDCSCDNYESRFCYDTDADGRYETISYDYSKTIGEEEVEGIEIFGGALKNSVTTSQPIFNKGNFNMYGGNFVGNSGSYGGVICVCEGATFTMSGGTMVGNTSSVTGGAVYAKGSAEETITIEGDSRICYNKSEYGGAISCHRSTIILKDNVSIDHNTASYNGGAINKDTGDIIINASSEDGEKVYIGDNTASDGCGGAVILNDKNGSCNFTSSGNVEISNNKATANSGGALMFFGTCTFTATGKLTMDENKCLNNGGAIAMQSSNVCSITVMGSLSMTGNACTAYNGGAILMNNGNIVLKGNQDNDIIKFAENEAVYYGGAIHLMCGSLLINKDADHPATVSFIDNKCTNYSGSAVYINNGEKLTEADKATSDAEVALYGELTFKGNEAKEASGACFYAGACENGVVLEGTITAIDNIGRYTFQLSQSNVSIIGKVEIGVEDTAVKKGGIAITTDADLEVIGREGEDDTLSVSYVDYTGLNAKNITIKNYKTVDISHNGGSGIYAGNLTIQDIETINLDYNGSEGLFVDNGSLIVKNAGTLTATHNASHGIEVDNSITMETTNINVSDNTYSGILCSGENDGSVSIQGKVDDNDEKEYTFAVNDNGYSVKTNAGLYVISGALTISGFKTASFNGNYYGLRVTNTVTGKDVSLSGAMTFNNNGSTGIVMNTGNFVYDDVDNTMEAKENAYEGMFFSGDGTATITAKTIDVRDNYTKDEAKGIYSQKGLTLKGSVYAGGTEAGKGHLGIYLYNSAFLKARPNTADDVFEIQYADIGAIRGNADSANNESYIDIQDYKVINLNNNKQGIYCWDKRDIILKSDKITLDNDVLDSASSNALFTQSDITLEGDVSITKWSGYAVRTNNGSVEATKKNDEDKFVCSDNALNAFNIVEGHVHLLYEGSSVTIDNNGGPVYVTDTEETHEYTLKVVADTITVTAVSANENGVMIYDGKKVLLDADTIQIGAPSYGIYAKDVEELKIDGSFTLTKDATGAAIYGCETALVLTGDANDTFTVEKTTGYGCIQLVNASITVDTIKSMTCNNSSGNGISVQNPSADCVISTDITVNNNSNTGLNIYGNNNEHTFTVNGFISADGNGKALYFAHFKKFILNGGCSLINSTGNSYAGAIIAFGTEIEFIINKDSTISNNCSGTCYNSGAVYCSASPLTIQGNNKLTVSNNGKLDTDAISYGGAFGLQASKATISGTTFTNNKAYRYGGAIYAYTTADDCDVTLTGCTFTENEVNGNGGAIYSYSNIDLNNYLTLTDCVFTKNAAYSGGAVLSYKMIISGCTFTENTGSYAYGGAVQLFDTATISGTDEKPTVFEDNTAYAGGAVNFSATTGSLTVSGNVQFNNNTSTNDGGALFILGTAEIKSGVSFDGNKARFGGAIFTQAGNGYSLKITGTSDKKVTISGNTATTSGGAVFCNEPATISFATFTSNTATEYGGGLFVRDGNISNSEFTENNARYGGGAYVDVESANNTYATFDTCTFTNNTATVGGGLYVYSYVIATVKEITMTENTATIRGSAICAQGSMTLESGAIHSNVVLDNEDGTSVFGIGAVWVEGNDKFYFKLGNTESKTLVIKDNYFGTDEETKVQSNLYFYQNASLDIIGLCEGSEISVAHMNQKYIGKPLKISQDVTDFMTEDEDFDTTYFVCDDKNYEVHSYKSDEKDYLYISAAWLEFDGITFDSFVLSNKDLTTGNYYLKEDTTFTETLAITGGDRVNLSLNGHSLTMTTSSINVYYSDSFNIYDNRYGDENYRHYFTVETADLGKNRWIPSENNAETDYYVDGGYITTSDYYGGRILIYSQMRGISYGGEVVWKNNDIVLHSGNLVGTGDAVYAYDSNFTMTGGTITGCVATDTSSTTGVVRMMGVNKTFTMTGGQITGNYIGDYLYAVKPDSTVKVVVGGTAYISGNYRNDGTQANLGIYATNDVSVSTEKPLEEGAKIGIFMRSGYDAWKKEGYSVAIVRSSADGVEYFTSDNKDFAFAIRQDDDNNDYIAFCYRLKSNPCTENSCTFEIYEGSYSNGAYIVTYEWYKGNSKDEGTFVSGNATLDLASMDEGDYICYAHLEYKVGEEVIEECDYTGNKVHYSDGILYERQLGTAWFEAGVNNSFVITAGRYYLNSNQFYTRNFRVEKDTEVVICLNGYQLDMRYYYHIENYGTLTINDCEANEKTYSYYDGRNVYLNDPATVKGGNIINGYGEKGGTFYNKGTLNLYGGSIIGSVGRNGSAVYNAKDAICNIDGANIMYNYTNGRDGWSTENGVRGYYTNEGAGTIDNHGTLHFISGKISNNCGNYGVGVTNSGTFTMDGGEIADNKLYEYFRIIRNGGGVYNSETGVFIMNGGEITGNSAINGGGVYNLGTMTMNGGEISGNKSKRLGAGICNSENAHLTVNEGTISNNVAGGEMYAFGAGIYNSGDLKLYNATIEGNETPYDGGGVYADPAGTVLLGKKTYIQNNIGYGKVSNLYIGKGAENNAMIAFDTENVPEAGMEVGINAQIDLFIGNKIFFATQTEYVSYLTNDDQTFYMDIEGGKIGLFTRITQNPTPNNEYEFIVDNKDYDGTITYAWYRPTMLDEYTTSVTASTSKTANTSGEYYYGSWTNPADPDEENIVLVRNLMAGDILYFTAKYNAPSDVAYTGYVGLLSASGNLVFDLSYSNMAEEYYWMIPESGNYYIVGWSTDENGHDYGVTVDKLTLYKNSSVVRQTGNKFDPNGENILEGGYLCIATGTDNNGAVDFRYISTVNFVHNCDHLGETVGNELLGARFYGGTLTSGKYYLRDDVTLAQDLIIPEGENVTICLNGHTITVGEFSIVNYGTLTICDCQDTAQYYIAYNKTTKMWSLTDYNVASENWLYGGCVSGHTGEGGAIENHNTFIMEGGNIVGNTCGLLNSGVTNERGEYLSFATASLNNCAFVGNSSEGSGSALNNQYGTVEINNVTFQKNYAAQGVIFTEAYYTKDVKTGIDTLTEGTGIVTMNSGKIFENTAIYGAAVTCVAGTFVMNDGEIYENEAEIGIINNQMAVHCFIMNGGTIYNNHVTKYGVVYNTTGVIKISGNATIKDNTAGKDYHADNLYTNVAITLTDAFTGEIGITYGNCLLTMKPFAITGDNGADYSSCFISDSDYYLIRKDENNANIVTLVPIAFSTQPSKETDFNAIVNDNEVTYQWYRQETLEVSAESEEALTGSSVDVLSFAIAGAVKVGDIVTFVSNAGVDVEEAYVTFGDNENKYTVTYDEKTGKVRFVVSVACELMNVSLALDSTYASATVSDIKAVRETIMKGCTDTTIEDITVYGEGSYFARATHKTATIDSNVLTTYRVTFSGGESTSGTDNTVLYNFTGKTITLPTTTAYRKADKKFIGWNADVYQTVGYFSYEITAEDKVLYAIWTDKKAVSELNTTVQTYFSKSDATFKVLFNQETTLKADEFTVYYKEKDTAASYSKVVPTKYGIYNVRLDRAEDEDNDGYASCALVVEGAFVLGYKVIVDANGGEGTYTADTVLFSGDTFTAPNGFTRDGYQFVKWYRYCEGASKSLTDYVYEGDEFEVTSNVTLYAYWVVDIDKQPTSTVPTVETTSGVDYQWYVGTVTKQSVYTDIASTLSGDKYSATIEMSSVTVGDGLSLKQGDRIILSVSGVSEVGVNTDKYFHTEVNNGKIELIYMAEENYVLYANDEFTVTDVTVIHYEGSKVKGEIASTINTEKVTKSKDYYCEVSYKACTGIDTRETFVCYTDAIVAYTVTFNKNGAKGLVSSVSNLVGRAVTLADPTELTYANKYFDGWNTQEDGEGVNYAKNALYTANGDVTLYAVWKDKAAITVIDEKQSLVYNGLVQSYSVRGSDLEGFVLTYRNKNGIKVTPKDVGVYTVVVTRDEDETYASFELSVSEGLTITKKIVTLSYAKNVFTYNGNNQIADVKASFTNVYGEKSELKVTKCYLKDEEETLGMFKNAGTYTIKYSLSTTDAKSYMIKGYENQENVSVSKEYDMQKATINMTGVAWDYDSLSYTGKAQEVTITGLPENVTVASYKGNKQTLVGAYVAEVVFSYDKKNYNEIDESTYELFWEIKKADFDLSGITWKWTKGDFVYDGTPKKVTMSGLPAGLVVKEYKNNVFTNAGTYYANAVFTFDSENYNDIVMDDFVWEIERAETVLDTTEVVTEYVYTGKEQAVLKGGKIVNHSETKVKYANNKFTNAGTYEIQVIAPQSENYQKAEATVEIHVAKKSTEIDVSGVKKTLYYNGQVQYVNAGATLNHIEAKPVYTENEVETVGSYAVVITAPETDNYLSATKTITVTVKKGTYDLSGIIFEDADYIYDGLAHTIAIEGTLPEGVSVRYMRGSTIFSSISEVGNYDITAEFIGDTKNYNIPETMKATLSIRTKTVTQKTEGDEVIEDFQITDCEKGVDSRLIYVAEPTVVANLSENEKAEFNKVETEKVSISDEETISLVYKVRFSLVEDGEETEVKASELDAGLFTIRMAVGNKVNVNRISKILQIDEKGTVTEIAFDASKVTEDGYYEIQSGEFVEFMFVEKANCTLHWYLLAWLVLMLVRLAIVLYANIKDREHKLVTSIIMIVLGAIDSALMYLLITFLFGCSICLYMFIASCVLTGITLIAFLVFYFLFKNKQVKA